MTRSETVTHFRGEQKYYSAFMQPRLAEACKIAADSLEAVERLEAEIQVRDNSANEVLRILREATGRRDFHSEMEAAEWAARMIIDLQTQLFMSQQSAKEAQEREAAAVSREIGVRAELAEARKDSARLDWIFNSNTCTSEEVAELINGFIWRGKYRGSGRAAIDAAMKEAK